jgi:hypothetical protein
MQGLYHPASSIRYSSYQKNDGSPWVKRAMATEGAKFYYWFARFPVAKLVNSSNGTHRVEFTDVRFFLPGIRMPFSYTSNWMMERCPPGKGSFREWKEARPYSPSHTHVITGLPGS